MAATFSRARSSRRATNPSGVRRGLAVVALTGGIAGFATLGIAAVTNPVQAAPGNNGTVKVSGADLSSQPNNEPHVPCDFYIQWYGFDTGTRHATVSFAAQAPTSGASYAVTGGSTSLSFAGGSGLDHTEAYTLVPSGADPQPQQGYHVKITVVTDKSHGSDHKSKVFWIGPCSVATTPPTDQTTPPTDDTTPPTDDTTPPTDDTTPPTEDTTPPTESGTVTVPPPEAGSVATSTAKSSPQPGGLASTSTSPGPGAVVPTRIESGFATMPTSASTSQHSSDRWPLLAVSGLSAALGAAGLFPRRRGAKRS